MELWGDFRWDMKFQTLCYQTFPLAEFFHTEKRTVCPRNLLSLVESDGVWPSYVVVDYVIEHLKQGAPVGITCRIFL